MDMIEIQVQDTTGNWRTYSITQNISVMIVMTMRSLKDQFPDQRVRDVDHNERFVDLMGENVKFISIGRSSVRRSEEYATSITMLEKHYGHTSNVASAAELTKGGNFKGDKRTKTVYW